MQFGMPTLIENQTLSDNIALCTSLGLKFIELNMNFPEYQIDKLEEWQPIYDAAQGNGIYYTINMHMHHGIFITLPDKKVQMYDRDFDVYMNCFKQFRSLCEQWIGDTDIKIAIENTDGFREYEKKAIAYLLESSCFVLTWDIGHSKATKEVDIPFLMEHKASLKHFHIHDGLENPPKNHLALGDGGIDLQERLGLAKACNARCVLETKTIEALKASVHWLQNNEFLK